MAINKEDILNSISEMSVKDVCELVEMMEKKFGVSSIMTTSPNPNQNNSPQNNVEAKTSFDVILTGCGSNRVSAIKAVRSVTSLGLKEAKDAIENLPFIIKKDAQKEEAESLKKKLEESGSKVELK